MSANGRPAVTVCIPAYNASTVVGDALRSALRQNYADLEILVLDNQSTDDTWRIVTEIAASDSRVRCIRHDENIGTTRNFNAGIASAKGEFVLILCSDDVLGEGCVELLASALCEHPDAAIAACGRVLVDRSMRPIRVLRARARKEEVSAAILLCECFAHGNRIGEPSAVMFRRKSAGRGFNPEYSQALDLEMWFHLLESGSAILLPEPLASIRQHGEQTTQVNIRSGRIVQDKRLIFQQYAARVTERLTFLERLTWDVRMASSVARWHAAGGVMDAVAITELFFPAMFANVLCPLIGIGWKFRRALASYR